MAEQDETQEVTEETAEDERNPVLTLSTQVEPPLTIEIDGEDFELRTMEHLSMTQETKLRALIAQEERLTEQLDRTPPEQESQLEGLAKRLQDIRIRTIDMMTNIGEGKIRSLPTFAQQKLIEIIGER